MKRPSPASCVALAGVLACAMTAASATIATAQAKRKQVTISALSAPFGTASYVLFGALEQISKKHPWLRIVASESPGFVFNLKKLDAEPALRKSTIIGSGPAVGRLATTGSKPFDKKLPKVKLIANYTIVVVWLAALEGNIKGPADVPGKRVALGKAAQINWAILPRAVMEHGWGIPASKVTLQYLGPKPAIAALLDRKADLAIAGAYIDPADNRIAHSPQTTELLATGRALTHLSWGTQAVTKTEPKGFAIAPYTIPAKKIDGKNPPLETFVDSAAWTVMDEFPEDIAYEVTKLIIQNIKAFGEVHAIGKLMSPKGLVYGWKHQDIHPGALRAYKEAGIIK
ncbi:MAG: TAXI family TRAP transporter solute-binding subunit [Hyphomicrobiaceae bacterium]